MAFAAPVFAALPVILGIVGTGLTIAGIVQQTQAQQQVSNYQAMVADRNAAIMEQNATRSLDRSRQDLLKQEEQTRALIGQQIAAQSASGLKLGGRSQMLTRKSARALGRQDAENVLKAGDIEAINFRQTAEDFRMQSTFARQEGANAGVAGALGVGSALVGGAQSFFKPGVTSLLGASKLSKQSVPGATKLRFA